jgi:sulfite dehydrogenase (quinone) subunit SoeC
VNPAFSVVMLTTASGAGYGMLFWLGLLNVAGVMPGQVAFGVVAVVVALGLATVGLMASTLHLGHPERSWRAISQWRSSWLSREGVVSLVTYVPAVGFMVAWGLAGNRAVATEVLGLVAGVLGLLTVFCQAMIYASLKPVRQWHTTYVPVNLLLLGLASGGACLAAVAVFWGVQGARVAAGLGALAAVTAAGSKLSYWRAIDSGRGAVSIESATGLGFLGKVTSFEWPHTEENYLLREMGFQIGRKHAGRLRRVAVWMGFGIPAALLVVGMIAGVPVAWGAFPVAAGCSLVGIYAERWLFFAEATHTSMLYYGRAV